MPPLETPLIILLLAKINKIIIGITTTVAAAINRSYRTPPSLIKAYNPNGSVLYSVELMTSKGHKKEFQDTIALSNAIAIKVGLAIGTIILHKYFQLLAPSTRADQYKVSGIDRKVFLRINT